MHPLTTEDVLKGLKERLDDLQYLRDREDDPNTKRALSVAITYLETSILWLANTIAETEG